MKNCEICGKPVYGDNPYHDRTGGVYCSRKCYDVFLKKQGEFDKKLFKILFIPIKLVFKLIGLLFWIICKILALPDKLFFSKKSQMNKEDAEGKDTEGEDAEGEE